MDKIVPFNKGIHRQPSLGEDGELSELVNLIPRNGELVNVRDMKPYVTGIENGAVFLGTHKVAVGDVLLFSKGDVIKFYTEANGSLVKFTDDIRITSQVKGMEVAGNIVALITNGGDYFLQYKDGGYLNLGSGYPELPISFDIKSDWVAVDVPSDKFSLTMTSGAGANGYYGHFDIVDNQYNVLKRGAGWNFSYGLKSGMDYIKGAITNKINAVREEGYFVYPFLVRCAYKSAISGSYVRVTPPVLMLCTTGSSAYFSVNGDKITGTFIGEITDTNEMFNVLKTANSVDVNTSGTINIHMNTLRYTFYKDVNFADWKDLISSMDIFVSDEIPTSLEELNVTCTDREGIKTSEFCVGNRSGVSARRSKWSDYGAGLSLFENHNVYWEPKRDLAEFEEDLENSRYNLLTSVKIDDLKGIKSGEYFDVNKTKDTTTTLVVSEDRSIKTSRNILGYNNRFVKSGDIKRYFPGDNVQTALQLLTGCVMGDSYSETCRYYVHLEKDGVAITTRGEDTEGSTYSLLYNKLHYFCYQDPDPNVYVKAVTFRFKNGDKYEYRRFDLKKDELNGYSYAQDILYGLFDKTPTVAPPQAKNDVVGDRSIIRFSEANDPTNFDELNTLKVSFGDILNIASSAKALSQGQFGQFPLYAFCTDGIWALSVDEEGKFDSNQPISRDVCNNPDSVTQIDGAVVFTTDQGLMMIQGSDVVCLSDVMNGNNINERDFFHSGFFAEQSPDWKDDFFDGLVISETRDFREILKTCRIAYDYVNKMLRIFPKENSGKYYVFSLESREFASVIPIAPYGNGETSQATTLDVKSVVAGYPSSIVQLGEALYMPSEVDDNSYLKIGLLLTRPISMNEPFAMKKLKDLKLYYSKFDGTSKCKVVVYVSNDGAYWEVLKSLHKCSYKYYRFAICTRMKDMDALSGMALRYELERTNKLR